ncbi:hypothetical protein LOD99_13596 [Oopsacas minuta]|uniref:Ion transport domain-containing protein n=1 Tax=Oopsacas minuta TaxID=111878 RepID=A0AAV7KHT2_9METZ|nr:hypothetical protein LOD99_13596 [Oopsacas minuta]
MTNIQENEDTDNLLNYNYSPDMKHLGYGAVSSPQSQTHLPSTLYPTIQDEPTNNLRSLMGQRAQYRSQTSSFSSFVSPSDEIYYRAAVLLEDAMLYRTTYHRFSYTALKIYKVYQSRVVQSIICLCIFVNLTLAFFEKPSSLSLTSDYRYRGNKTSLTPLEPPCGVTECIELVTLLFFLVDYIITFYQVGWRAALTKIWLHLYIFTIIFSLADLTVSLGLRCNGYIGARKLLRPIFLFQHSSYMKKSLKAIRLTIPQMFAVFFMLCLHIFVFALLGMLLFPVTGFDDAESCTGILNKTHNNNSNYTGQTEGDRYFSGLIDSVRNLIFLLSTANNPNIMIPVYKENRLTALYFIAFFTIGSYILLNIFTAVVYNQFRYYLRNSMQQSKLLRHVGVRTGFVVLERQERDEELGIIDKVSLDTLTKLLPYLRFAKKQSLQVYKEELSLHRRQDMHYLHWPEFESLIYKLYETPSKKNRNRGFIYHNNRALRIIQWAILSPVGLIVQNFISFLNTVLICIELELCNANAPQVMSTVNFVFVCYYVIELVVKFLILRKQFFKRKCNIYELFVTCSIVILQVTIIVYVGVPFKSPSSATIKTTRILIKVLCMFIVLRLLRLLTTLRTFSFILEILFTIIKKFKSFAGLVLSLYYFYAFLGMMLFSDVDRRVKPGARQKVCGTFEEMEFFANNFQDFYAAIIVLWDLMIVNNWNVFVEAYRKAYTEWVTIYFFSWYILSVIIGINLLIAIILEAFIGCWEDRNDKLDITLEQINPIDSYGSQRNANVVSPNVSVRGLFHNSKSAPDISSVEKVIEKHPFL